MERRQRHAPRPMGAFTDEAVDSLRALPEPVAEQLLLGYFPAFTTNPYQALLYGQARSHGIAPVPLDRDDQIDELAALRARGFATVLHLHWLHPILRAAKTPEDAEAAIAAFLRRLDAYRGLGGRVAWTIHNVLPHGATLEREEARLSAEVARRADVIHVLARGTVAHVAPHFELPLDRIIHVDHPSYAGAYPDHIGRLDARHELEILPDEFVYAVVGAIRPYKGIGPLLDAWQALPRDGSRRLVIAGEPSDEPGIRELLERAALDASVVLDARKLPVQQVQVVLRAADVAVLPYIRALNSGALALALTFGLPAIVPAGGALAEVTDARFARTFTPGDPEALRAALVAAPGWVDADARAAALERARELDPATLSDRFAVALRERLAAVASVDP